jgi:hypothetical protein
MMGKVHCVVKAMYRFIQLGAAGCNSEVKFNPTDRPVAAHALSLSGCHTSTGPAVHRPNGAQGAGTYARAKRSSS